MSITLYEHADFRGREITLYKSTPDLRLVNDFNDKASSAKVTSGVWQLYEHVDYKGKYMEVTPGDYNSAIIIEKLGNDIISSVKKL